MLIGFTSTLCLAQDFLVTFNNQTGEEHKGCVAYGYRADGTETRKDGVKPVPAGVSVTFNLGPCSGITHWRFVAAIKYSDRPENNDIVLMDTGKDTVTASCKAVITGRKASRNR